MELNKIAFGNCDCLGETLHVEACYNEENNQYVCPYCNGILKDLKVYNF